MLIQLFSGDYRSENEADVIRPARRPLLLLLLLRVINFNSSHRQTRDMKHCRVF